MVRAMMFAATLAAVCFTGNLQAADGDSECLAKGDPIGAFYVTKVAGANEDGVEPGDELCYRCRYGQSPMVMVFARKNSDQLTALIGELDKAVAKNSDHRLKSFVTLVGGDGAALQKEAKKLASSTTVSNVPVVVAKDAQNGPRSYKLDPNSDVTVVIANNSQVVANHSFAAGKVDAAAVLKDVQNAIQ